MKFLPPEYVRPHIIPLNIIYHNPYSLGDYESVDILTIIYKDQDTGEKFVYEIKNPTIEIYITKPEYRTYEHMRDMITIDQCDKYKVQYSKRWKFAANKLKLENADLAKSSPYIFNIDIPIENYYLIQFILEYPSDTSKTLSIGKLDIENDIISFDSRIEYGEAPVNAVTYINMDNNDVYTLVLLKDSIPDVSINHPKYAEYSNLREKFYRQVDEINKNPDYVLEKCHEKFDETYPGMNYNLLYYTDELQLLKDLMYIIHSVDNDYIGIWNMPYDMQNIIMRIIKLGGDVGNIIADERCSVKKITFVEDTNPTAHKRNHQCITYTIPTFVDDMVHYSRVRSGRGVIPSLKLNNVAKVELKDEKYDYSEISDIKHLFYDDLLRFILYNIKDVLLLTGLEAKTKDTTTVYSRMYQMCVFPREAFTTTKVVWYSLIKFMFERGYVPGINRNKGNNKKTIIDYSSALINQISDDDDFTESEFLIESDDNESSEESDKEEKYQGAFVMNTAHMQPTGVKIMGHESKFVHDNVADMDIESEYPTTVCIGNISNETLVGKIYLEDPNSVDIPISEGFVFRGDEREKYKMDKNNYLLEVYTENDVFNFSELFLDLPSVEEVLSGIEDKILKS